MERRYRLSRSRDFEAVYRHGRATSSRFLVLYWFERDPSSGDPSSSRLGIAVPKKVGGAVIRNRLKRQLREIWCGQAAPLTGKDYVLIARPGLAEAAASQGFDWLRECVSEVADKAAGLQRQRVAS